MVNIDVARERSVLWIWVFTLLIVALVLVGLYMLAEAPDRRTASVSQLLGLTLTQITALSRKRCAAWTDRPGHALATD